MNTLILFFIWMTATIALGQDPTAEVPDPISAMKDLENLDGDLVAKIVGIVVGLQVLLYGAGEALTRISKFTDATWDNKAAELLSQGAWVIGSLISKFGYSAPKLVIQEKADKIAEKELKEKK